MAKDSVFTHDILPRIRADHPVISVITHEWERLNNMLLDASEELDRKLLRVGRQQIVSSKNSTWKTRFGSI